MKSLLFCGDNKDLLPPAVNAENLVSDLNLKYIFDECANGSTYIARVIKDIMLRSGIPDSDNILYRQEIMRDFIANQTQVKELYTLVSAALNEYDEAYAKNRPTRSWDYLVSLKIRNTIDLYQALLESIIDIKQKVSDNIHIFKSRNVLDYFAAFNDFYSDQFISDAFKQLKQIAFMASNDSMTLSACLGYGLKSGDIYIRPSTGAEKNRKKIKNKNFTINMPKVAMQSQSVSIRKGALLKLQRIINDLTGSTLKHLKDLNYALAFYLGSANLYNTLKTVNVPVSFPVPAPVTEPAFSFKGLTDMSLALQNKNCPVGNSINFGGNTAAVVTGANQGGKSTFLRSVGIAQLMMQCGMFVSAEYYSADCRDGVFTHFCRPDSGSFQNGKLDGELVLMRELVNRISRHSLILMNESFSSTSEKDAVSIVSELLRAFSEAGVRVIYVTHFYSIAKRITAMRLPKILFLTAMRNDDGTRPYIITEGSPAETSYGMDIYKDIFGDD